MSYYRVDSKNASKVIENVILQQTNNLKSKIVDTCYEGSEILNGVVKEVLRGERHGRQYGRHIASAPGEPPAVDTGQLRNSFAPKTKVNFDGATTTIESKIVSNLAKSGANPDFNYAWIDEGYGGVAPRPYREKVAEKAVERLGEKLRNKI